MASSVLEGINGPLILVCFSMGAMVGLEIIRRNQARIQGVAFISADLRSDSQARKLARSRLQQELSQLGIGEVFIRSLRSTYFPGPARPVAAEQLVVNMAATAGLEVFLRQLSALDDRPSTSTLLAEIACPSLFIRAADDPLCPLGAEDYIKEKIRHIECICTSEGGHFLPLTMPNVVSAALSKWMSNTVERIA